MNSTCAYCGDRFICGAINEVVKLKFNFSKKSETARIKDHCETLSITTSERIKAEGTKSESDLRHETTKAYIEEIVLRSKKKRKSDSLRKRFEKGVKLGELKYYSQPDKKSSQKVYKKLVQARLVIPLKSFDDYKSTYPERATLNYRTYVKDILTQDPYHLSTKGNYEGYYTFALYPDGDVLKANQALVRNTASVGGSLGGGGSGGGSAGGAPKAGPNAEVMRAPAVPGGEKLVGGSAEAESSPKATLNDQGQWVVENKNSNKAAKPVDMRVLNNASGSSGVGSGGTDFGAGSDLMNFYKTGNESASTNSGTQNLRRRTTTSNALAITPDMLTNSVSSNTKTSTTNTSSSSVSTSTSTPISTLKSLSAGVDTLPSSPGVKIVPTGNVATFIQPSLPKTTPEPDGSGVPEIPLGDLETAIEIGVQEKLNRMLGEQGDDSSHRRKERKTAGVFEASESYGNKGKISDCNNFDSKMLEFSRQKGVCNSDLEYYVRCRDLQRYEVIELCEEAFNSKIKALNAKQKKEIKNRIINYLRTKGLDIGELGIEKELTEAPPKEENYIQIGLNHLRRQKIKYSEDELRKTVAKNYHKYMFPLDRKREVVEQEKMDCDEEIAKGTISRAQWQNCQNRTSSIDRCYSRLVKTVNTYQPKESPEGTRDKESLISIWQLESDYDVVRRLFTDFRVRGDKDATDLAISKNVCENPLGKDFLAVQRILRQTSKKIRLSSDKESCQKTVISELGGALKELPKGKNISRAADQFERNVNLSIMNKRIGNNKKDKLAKLKELSEKMKPYVVYEQGGLRLPYVNPWSDEEVGTIAIVEQKVSRPNWCEKYAPESSSGYIPASK